MSELVVEHIARTTIMLTYCNNISVSSCVQEGQLQQSGTLRCQHSVCSCVSSSDCCKKDPQRHKSAGQQHSAAENKQISDVTWLARRWLHELAHS